MHAVSGKMLWVGLLMAGSQPSLPVFGWLPRTQLHEVTTTGVDAVSGGCRKKINQACNRGGGFLHKEPSYEP